MTTILLTGKNGQLGWELHRTLSTIGQVHAFDRTSLDLGDESRIRKIITDLKPDIIVNAAAYTAVDQAENESGKADRINARAPEVMAEEAERNHSVLIHYSTDYVFDGSKESPYSENDRPSPVNIYGRSKQLGEERIQQFDIPYLILRTSWVYSHRGNNFLLTMLRLMQEREKLTVVNDQFGSPTSGRTIAEITAQILSKYLTPDLNKDALKEKRGIYHLTSTGKTSWYGYAKEIYHLGIARFDFHPNVLIEGIPSDKYPSPAKRPINSVLTTKKIHDTFGVVCPDWKESLKLCIEDIPEKYIQRQ